MLFDDVSENWGLDDSGFSNGSAYADFDNDGDLDLIVSNIDDMPFFYENTSANNYLKVYLKQDKGNHKAFNAKVKIEVKGNNQMIELAPNRGYFSTSEVVAHFGLKDNEKADVVWVYWNDGKVSKLTDIEANQALIIEYGTAFTEEVSEPIKPLFADISEKSNVQNFKHKENYFNDFAEQILLPHQMSELGPFVTVGDVNGDGLEDFFVGGASGQAGSLFLQNTNGSFTSNSSFFAQHKKREDMDALFFDADNDDDLDLYVVSGGFEFEEGSEYYGDRLYNNDGNGNFSYVSGLPSTFSSGSCVSAGDFNKDGFLDLFVGGRVMHNKYPYAPESYLLINNKDGSFADDTDKVSKSLGNIGMVTDAEWLDYNDDGNMDLVIAGEWMPITFLTNKDNTSLVDETAQYGDVDATDWWSCLELTDIDKDGDQDIIAGNLGLNYKFSASNEKPLHVYCEDLDQNGTYDVILAKYAYGNIVPVRGKECSSQQIPSLNNKFKTYTDFAVSDVQSIFGEGIESALHLKATTLESVILRNENAKFKAQALPLEAQISPINGSVVSDVNEDGLLDIIIAGNMHGSEVETSRADAGIGYVMLQQPDGSFQTISNLESGFFANKDVKDIQAISLGKEGQLAILVTNNDEEMQLFSLN